jgi:hypothetical protein
MRGPALHTGYRVGIEEREEKKRQVSEDLL